MTEQISVSEPQICLVDEVQERKRKLSADRKAIKEWIK